MSLEERNTTGHMVGRMVERRHEESVELTKVLRKEVYMIRDQLQGNIREVVTGFSSEAPKLLDQHMVKARTVYEQRDGQLKILQQKAQGCTEQQSKTIECLERLAEETARVRLALCRNAAGARMAEAIHWIAHMPHAHAGFCRRE